MKIRLIPLVFWIILSTAGVFCVQCPAADEPENKAKELLEGTAKNKLSGVAPSQQEETITRPKPEIDIQAERNPFQGPIIKKLETKKDVILVPSPIRVPSIPGLNRPSPSASIPAAAPSLTVQGIVWGGNFPQAIVNNSVVKIGDEIEKAKITGIDKEGVTVLSNNKQYKFTSQASADNSQDTKQNEAVAPSIVPPAPVTPTNSPIMKQKEAI